MNTLQTESTLPEIPKDQSGAPNPVAEFREELRQLEGEALPPSGPVIEAADFLPVVPEKAQEYIDEATARHPSSGNQLPARRNT